MNSYFPLENIKIMTNLNYHNRYSKTSYQKSLATIGLSELARAARTSELKNIKNDDDVWLVTMLNELTASEKKHGH
ncbi:MAG: hypothetical protein ABI230_04225 [Aestuariivirga sp.]